MINSHLLYRLSYRGTTARMLLIKKEKSTLYRDFCLSGIRQIRRRYCGRGFSRDSSGGSRLKRNAAQSRQGQRCLGIGVGAPPRDEALAFAVLCRTIRG